MSTVALIDEITFKICSLMNNERNLLPSEIYSLIGNKHPQYSYYEIKYTVKLLEKKGVLINDIVYGGLRIT